MDERLVLLRNAGNTGKSWNPNFMWIKKKKRKSVRIRSYSGPYFPACRLNVETYSVSLRLLSECGKIPISSYSVGMWKNTNQSNSKYEHFSRSAKSKCYCFNHSRRSRIQNIFLVGQPWWLTILVSVPWLLYVGAPVFYIYYICI